MNHLINCILSSLRYIWQTRYASGFARLGTNYAYCLALQVSWCYGNRPLESIINAEKISLYV